MSLDNDVAKMTIGAPPESAPEWRVAPGKRQSVKCCRSKSEMQAVAEPIGRNGERVLMKSDGNIMGISIVAAGVKNNHHHVPSRKRHFSSAAEWSERSGAADGVPW